MINKKVIVAYVVGRDGKVRPLIVNESKEVIVEETVVDEGY